MKVVLFGNTNNYPLILAQAFRRAGIDAHLVVTRTEMLHRPEFSDTALGAQYGEWIHDFSHRSDEEYAQRGAEFKEAGSLFEGADGVLLNHLGPSLRALYKGPAIAFLTGSDLDYYANFAMLESRTASWSEEYRETCEAVAYTQQWRTFIERQRTGIRDSEAVSFFPRGLIRDCDRLLDDIGVTDAQRFHIYFGDCESIPFQPAPEPRREVRIFCGARLTWKKPISPGASELDFKGTDIALHGVSRLLRQLRWPWRRRKLQLRLVEKGAHVEQTKALVTELKLDAHVVWLPEMPRHRFLEELAEADICIDNLGESVVGLAGLDAMATGRPLIANARPSVYAGMFNEPIPICHADTPATVEAHLARLIDHPEQRARIGAASRDFVLRYWSPAANVQTCLEKLGLSERASTRNASS